MKSRFVAGGHAADYSKYELKDIIRVDAIIV
jgi:hypothetical protein